jgi:hypothetical protein
MSDAPSPRWITGILALIVAAVAIGALGWMLWPRYTLPPAVTVEPLRFRQSPQIILRLANMPASAASAILVLGPHIPPSSDLYQTIRRA